jgi:hydrogenase expression/formation protein HypC
MCLGIPGRIVQMSDASGLPMGVVDFGGARREVCLAYVADRAAIGDYVIVHVGFAIGMLDEREAETQLRLLRAMSAQADDAPLDDAWLTDGAAS